jgi:hypothetical protein
MSTSVSFLGEFAIWSFTIGHGRLLLRRTKSKEHPTRVDILLKDVGWMCIPATFTDIQIREGRREDVEDMLLAAGSPREAGRKVFVLSGPAWRGYVLAAVVASREDDGEYDDPSALLE